MSIIQTIVSWVAEATLKFLLGLIQKEVLKYERQLEREKADATNQKAYEEAQDRQARIDAALALLNGAKP